jgi:uncharacterized protein (TIGR02594 family)
MGDIGKSLTAEKYIGLNEYQNRQQIKQLIGVDPVRTEWCAAFVNAVLSLEGISNNDDHKFPLLARSFLEWGQEVDPKDIQVGDIVVFPRGNSSWKGHVGFYVGPHEHSDKWVILGGNQANSVRYDLYDPKRALGVRRGYKQGEKRGSLPLWITKY